VTEDGGPAEVSAGGDRTPWTRRRVLKLGGFGVLALAAAGAVGVDLVDHGVLPGKGALDELDGDCSVSDPSYAGATHSAAFGGGLKLEYPLAAVVQQRRAPPFVLAAADGGNGYWHSQGDDDPLATAFTSAADFAAHDVVTHASRLDGVPVQIRGGISDPFAPSTVALQSVLGRSRVILSKGCHTGPFFDSVAPMLLAFAGWHLA
jgi:hypothetical protein